MTVSNTPITQLSQATSAAAGDLFYIVASPATTPTDKAITLANLFYVPNLTPFRLDSAVANSPFQILSCGLTYNGQLDPSLIIGYNATQGGARVNTSDANLFLIMEANYRTNSYYGGVFHNFMEMNIDFNPADGSPGRRLMGMAVDRDNPDAFAGWTFAISPAGGTFAIARADTMASLWSIASSGQMFVTGVISSSATGVQNVLELSGAGDVANNGPNISFRNTNVNKTWSLGPVKTYGGFNLGQAGVADGRLFVKETTGEVGVNTTAPLSPLDVNGNRVRVRTALTPSGSADATGNVGDICWDTGFLYVKTAAGAWKRAALGTF